MPTPIEILLDPISLGLLAIYFALLILEHVTPARPLTPVKGWPIRAAISFIIYFYLATYLPLFWDKYLTPFQLIYLDNVDPLLSTLVAVLVFECFIYIWHRTMHKNHWLWRTFHQMHHSAERVDVLGAFYFSPLDMIGFTFIGSLSLSVVAGLSAQAITWFLLFTLFIAVFQHTNVKTPRWLGYFIQRPESHSVHHENGIHAYNYSDLPIFDIIFGTFKNPKNFAEEAGFYHGASARIKEMLMFEDVSRPKS